MSWEDTLGKWSRTTYGILHSLAIVSDLEMGNLRTLEKNVERSLGWVPSSLGFVSAVDPKPFTKGSIRLDGRQAKDVLGTLLTGVAEMLFVDLVALCDELLGEILVAKGTDVSGAPFFIQKVNLVAVPPREQWSRQAMVEMNAVRNCIIHNNSRWNDRNAENIEKIRGVKPAVGTAIQVGFVDVFNYKRATRTFLGTAAR
jgi:hypothetical protein